MHFYFEMVDKFTLIVLLKKETKYWEYFFFFLLNSIDLKVESKGQFRIR